jgi:hypothetical protein
MTSSSFDPEVGAIDTTDYAPVFSALGKLEKQFAAVELDARETHPFSFPVPFLSPILFLTSSL